MLKKTISFENLDGKEISEDFYFHMNEVEIVEMEASFPEGMETHVRKMLKSNDRASILAMFKELIRKSYGVRSDDGKRFIKTEEVWNEFSQTDAYSALFLQLVGDANAAAEFFNGVISIKARKKLQEAEASATVSLEASEEVKDERPAWIREDRDPTKEELRTMNADQLREVYVRRISS